MNPPYLSLYWALFSYAGAAVALVAGSRRLVPLLLCAGCVVNGLPIVQRYSQAWPMLPMHLAPLLTPFVLACMLLIRLSLRPAADTPEHRAWLPVLAAMVACLAAAQLFPKDFYLPFLRSDSPFAHATLVIGAAGRACFIFSMAWGMVFFTRSAAEERSACMRRALLWASWGFVFWTLSMFSGEMWAYLGWGTPVVWHDPAILLMMVVWFLYIALLHLHFSRVWGLRGRAVFAACGGIIALVCSLFADFGPFRPPW